ncbi:1-acyl-sn-glycerol-3-phosphate acyltransferase [Dolichospermum sp. ST_sed1]|nr:1-acyl-sn-glycerol-3-phosphate acyltransferase [Dolichospermum sp. ST_sed1]
MNNNKLIFVDVDDTLISPPYDSVKKIANILRVKNFPTKEQMYNRNHIDFYSAFPHVFKSKNHMWKMALLSIPFGLFKSQESYADYNIEELKSVLNQPNVFLLSKNPPIFTRWRLNRLQELFGVDFSGRYIACGPIFAKSKSKVEIIQSIARFCDIPIENCMLIDDNSEEIVLAKEIGVSTHLLETTWNLESDVSGLISRSQIAGTIANWNQYPETTLIPNEKDREKSDVISFDYASSRLVHLWQTIKNKLFDNSKFSISLANGFHLFGTDNKNEVFDYLKEFKPQKLVIKVPKWFEIKIPMNLINAITDSYNPRLEHYLIVKNRIFQFYSEMFKVPKPLIKNVKYYNKNELVDKMVKLIGEEEAVLAKKYCLELISSCSKLGTKIAIDYQNILCKFLFRRIITKIPYDLAKLEEENFVVYMPTHRSFFDTSLMVKILIENCSMMARFPAALKMKKNIVGLPGRFGGIFYIRRDGFDNTYFKILDNLIREFMENSTSMVVFAEGKRSRTGLTLNAKNGIMQSINKNRDVLKNRNLCIVPVSFTYNILPESELMEKEAREEYASRGITNPLFNLNNSKTKSWGFFFAIVKSFLKSSSISDVYVNFGKPEFVKSKEEFVDTKAILNNVFQSIQTSSPVVSTSLICLILSASENKCSFVSTVKDQLNFLSFVAASLKYGNNELTRNLGDEFSNSLKELPFINTNESSGNLDKNKVIYIDHVNTIKASNYANNVLHHYALAAIVAKSIYVNKSGNINDLTASLYDALKEVNKTFIVPVDKTSIKKLIKVFALFRIVKLNGEDFQLVEHSEDENFKILLNIANVVEKFVSSKLNLGFKRKNFRYKINFPIFLLDANKVRMSSAKIIDLSQSSGLMATESQLNLEEEYYIEISDYDIMAKIFIKRINFQEFVFDFVVSEEQSSEYVQSIFYRILSEYWKFENQDRNKKSNFEKRA